MSDLNTVKQKIVDSMEEHQTKRSITPVSLGLGRDPNLPESTGDEELPDEYWENHLEKNRERYENASEEYWEKRASEAFIRFLPPEFSEIVPEEHWIE